MEKEQFFKHKFLPVATIILAIVLLWYVFAVILNAPFQRDLDRRGNVTPTIVEFIGKTLAQPKPTLPAPHQVAQNVFENTFLRVPTSNRSLVYNAWITLVPTAVGFAFGTILGVLFAVGIVHLVALDRSLMPWIIASQTILIRHRADDHRRLQCPWHRRADPEGADFHLSVVLPGHGRHDEGPALAGNHASRSDAHL